eukprot:TRINITY_DN125474_c0_g1_i1.p1 TRINITY_DN125474_c0_g1~~TRINITY_DN125474_c0_g1_i1.p1  ORF type:complete len:323 (-),score=59.51 TRINITY_DN125474_c0_g1_i1:48-1016(-)
MCVSMSACAGIGDGVDLREVPGRGVAAFAAKDFQAGDLVFSEPALVVSAVCVPSSTNGDHCNEKLWEALKAEERSRKHGASYIPSGHLGALAALRDLGPKGCREKLLCKCSDAGCSTSGAAANSIKQEAKLVHAMIGLGLLPKDAAAVTPEEYAQLRLVVQLNGFRFNMDLKEGAPGYDVGECLFNNICRINHSCSPNLTFDLSWNAEDRRVYNHVSAATNITAGDEINISYLPVRLSLPVSERRKQLKEHWGFLCDCQRCLDEGGPPEEETQEEAAVTACETGVGSANSAAPTGVAERFTRKRASSSSSSEGVCWDDLGEL